MGVEDLYDVPPVEVLLRGGCRDGERMFVPEELATLMMPPPEPSFPDTPEGFRARLREMRQRAAAGPQPVMPTITLYQRAGITDDGLRVYEAVR